MSDGSRSYFPRRVPRTVKFHIDDSDLTDQYARLYAPDIVDTINTLTLPRYGLGNYIFPAAKKPATPEEARTIQDLSRAGKRLMGFCRTNLYKRLERAAQVFCKSIQRHILRNYIYLHALNNNLPIPVGTQDADLLDTDFSDMDRFCPDAHVVLPLRFDVDQNGSNGATTPDTALPAVLNTPEGLQQVAASTYRQYAGNFSRRFKWLRPALIDSNWLARHLRFDADALLGILTKSGDWDAVPRCQALVAIFPSHLGPRARKGADLHPVRRHGRYLTRTEARWACSPMAGARADSGDPTALAWRFSPDSNEKRAAVSYADELRVLIATDVSQRGPEPAGLRDRRQLRPALGDHPPDPAGGPR